MDKMLIVVFDSERQAYEATRVLKELHNDGTITLYGEAVIAKDADGTVAVKQAADEGPLGTAVGLVTGSLVGLLGGPVGMLVGGATGAAGGAMFDIGTTVVGSDFLNEAAKGLQPGKAAVVAEVEEEWVLPLDTRMEAIGGKVFRRTRGEVAYAQIERDVTAMEADITAMETEAQKASGEAKTKLQARIDAAKAQLQQARDRAKGRVEATQREAEAKIAALKEQADRTRAEHKAQVDKRAQAVKADYEERRAKLDQALHHRKETSGSTRQTTAR
jgi:uncharacterized membrane protein